MRQARWFSRAMSLPRHLIVSRYFTVPVSMCLFPAGLVLPHPDTQQKTARGSMRQAQWFSRAMLLPRDLIMSRYFTVPSMCLFRARLVLPHPDTRQKWA